MAFFQSFTESLKQKWLQFFQVNREWIVLHMEVESVYTPDGGRRPPSYLILGVVNALEPKLAQLMLPFSRLNTDADTLIEVLDLHFDPDIALGNRILPKPEIGMCEESEELINSNSRNGVLSVVHTNGFAAVTEDGHEVGMESSYEETMMIPNVGVEDELRSMQDNIQANGTSTSSLDENAWSSEDASINDELHQSPEIETADEFGSISFGETLSAATSEANGFAEVLSDVWGNEAATQKGETDIDNEILLGEELSADGFDDTEMTRLFPNT